MEKEKWVKLDKYLISSNGVIKTDDYYAVNVVGKYGKIGKRLIKGHVLNTGTNSSGYEILQLKINGKRSTFLVHRLVAEAFIPNPNNYDHVHHRDGNKLNNRVDNLEWVDSFTHLSKHSKGKTSPMKGKHMSEETKKKLSEAFTGDKNPRWKPELHEK